MKYEELKQEIKEITAIAESVPEAFREKCFELLLNKVLARETRRQPPEEETNKHKRDEPEAAEKKAEEKKTESASLVLQGQVKAFMRRRDITAGQIETLLMIEDGQVHFIKEPAHGEAKRGQNEWALLLALKNAVLNNVFKADPEDVRSIVQEKGFYNQANFANNFKGDKYGSYFKEPLKPQGPTQPLTQEGEKALADLIKNLTA